MKNLIAYIFILFFAAGSLQAGAHYCVNMDQDQSSQSSTSNELPCHSQTGDTNNDSSENDSCCGHDCGTCAGIYLNSSSSTQLDEHYALNNFSLAFSFVLSRYIEIPVPPPNS